MNSTGVKINGKERTKDVLIDESINFDSLLLSEDTLKGLKNCGFQKPSPIQLKALPLGRCGFDLIVKSKSGTGKTAVFAVIALEMINLKKNSLQVLIIAPTREIAVQGCEVIKAIGAEFKDLNASCFIGGLSLEDDVASARKCQIAVGSPGRIKHLINAGHLKTDHVRLLVLDEADKLMESSYQADINEIYHRVPVRKQMIALSATYPDELNTFLAKYMITPTHVTPESDTPLLLGLKQIVSVVKPSLNVMQQMEIKIDEIVKLLSKISFAQCLIFSNFQTRAESVSNILNRRGWSSGFISGSQSQEERMCAIKDLKEYKCRILLSTDLTSRGIDASNVDLVINYDVPHDASTYLHRMGRAGRYGSRGICVTIAARGKELIQLQTIIGMIGGRELTIAQMPDEIPEGIWEADFRTFEQIPGKIPDGNVTEESMKLNNIKSSILELKSSRCKAVEEINSELSDAESILNSLSEGKRPSMEKEKDLPKDKSDTSDMSDTESILKSLSQGKRPCIEKEIDGLAESSSVIPNIVKEKIIGGHDKSKVENETNVSNTEDILKMLSEDRTQRNDSTSNTDILKMLASSEESPQTNHSNTKMKGNSVKTPEQSDTTSILRMLSSEKVDDTNLLEMPSEEGKKSKSLAAIDVFKLLSDDVGEVMDTLTEKQNTQNSRQRDTEEPNIELKQSDDTSSKRKREDKKSVQQDKRRTSTCAKNISLMNVTKLLLDDDFSKVQDDITENLSSYLDHIKRDISDNSLEEISSESEERDNPKENYVDFVSSPSYDQANSDIKENIFLLAYTCAIDPTRPHWSNFVDYTEEIIEDEKVVNLLNCSDGYEQDDSEEMFHPRHKSRHRKKSWTKRKNTQVSADNVVDAVQVPGFVESTHSQEVAEAHPSTDLYSYHEYGGCRTFDSAFQDCSNVLAERVTEFEDAESFDAWFLQWQQQVHSVRDYVQQNVYLQEMNRYHYYKAQ